jgi:hypothetical protein
MNIGLSDADDDIRYLEECFLETGQMRLVRDVSSPKAILLGRTGTGKTAIVRELQKSSEHAIWIRPEDLALNYISNSDIIRFFEGLGVNLDLFYQLLWKHVFAVELIKCRFAIHNAETQQNFWSLLRGRPNKDRNEEEAFEYIRKYADEFWLDTEALVKQVVSGIEEELEAAISGTSIGIPVSISATSNLKKEVITDIVHKAQKVVNSVQIRKLNKVIDVLAEKLFDDPQKLFYLLVDKLDERWVDDKIRYKLIRALIETLKTFRRIKTVKIVFTMRADLLQRVFRETRDAGFQQEKYEDVLLRLKWTQPQLRTIIDTRINKLIRETYTKQGVGFSDLFAEKVGTEDSFTYMLNRTFMRPRDIILFVNECLIAAQDRFDSIPAKVIREAEGHYVRKRYQSLLDEWVSTYPALDMYCRFLEGRSAHNKLSEITGKELSDFALEISVADNISDDPIFPVARKIATKEEGAHRHFAKMWISTLYQVGAVGLKLDSHEPWVWSYKDQPNVLPEEIREAAIFSIHPMVGRLFGIAPRS